MNHLQWARARVTESESKWKYIHSPSSDINLSNSSYSWCETRALNEIYLLHCRRGVVALQNGNKPTMKWSNGQWGESRCNFLSGSNILCLLLGNSVTSRLADCEMFSVQSALHFRLHSASQCIERIPGIAIIRLKNSKFSIIGMKRASSPAGRRKQWRSRSRASDASHTSSQQLFESPRSSATCQAWFCLHTNFKWLLEAVIGLSMWNKNPFKLKRKIFDWTH